MTVTGNPQGPTVVLAHGFGCDQNMWRLTVPALADEYRVVLFDYVGSGRSDLSVFSEDRYRSLEGYPDMARVFARTTFLSDSRNGPGNVSVPTLVLECTQDAIAPREVGAFVHKAIPGSTLITLDTTGHCPHLPAPEATNEAITGFLAGLR